MFDPWYRFQFYLTRKNRLLVRDRCWKYSASLCFVDFYSSGSDDDHQERLHWIVAWFHNKFKFQHLFHIHPALYSYADWQPHSGVSFSNCNKSHLQSDMRELVSSQGELLVLSSYAKIDLMDYREPSGDSLPCAGREWEKMVMTNGKMCRTFSIDHSSDPFFSVKVGFSYAVTMDTCHSIMKKQGFGGQREQKRGMSW